MRMPQRPQPLSTYLNQAFTCQCGKEHYAPLKAVSIRSGALEDLPDLVKKLGYRNPYFISDPVTYEIAGRTCMEILQKAGIPAVMQILEHTGFDEATLGELLIHMPADCDLCVAVGTGAINDMTRYLSFRMGRPFFTVATAAPMDGFASSVAALNVNHLKTTFEAQTPTAILGDTQILKNAPYRMIAAGLGDLLGKFTCLCDWKLSNLINGEHYCATIAQLVDHCVRGVLEDADRARDRDPAVLGGIMEGLVLTGVAMSLYGNSRPASGCEHHMSHYWEMLFEQEGRRPVPHGAQVSVGTVLVLKLVEELKAGAVDFAAARRAALAYDEEIWEKEIVTAYGSAAQGIIDLERLSQKNETMKRLRRIDAMEANWTEVLALLDELPASREIMALLKGLDSPCLPAEIGVDEKMLRNTLLYCKEVRNRYTILQMLWDLELLKPLTDQVIRSIGENAAP